MSDISSELAQMADRLAQLCDDLHKLSQLTRDAWDEKANDGDNRLEVAHKCVISAADKVWEAKAVLYEAVRQARRAGTIPTEAA